MKRIILSLLVSFFAVEQIEAATESQLNFRLHPSDLQNNSYNICEGYPGLVYFFADGKPENVKGKKAELHIETPDFIKLDGSSYVWNVKGDKQKQFIPDKITEEIGNTGKSSHIYKITLCDKLLSEIKDKTPTHLMERLYFSADKESAGRSATIHFLLLLDGKLSAEKSVVFNVLPPLKMPNQRTKYFTTGQSFIFSTLGAPNQEIRDNLLNYWRGLTATDIFTSVHSLMYNLTYEQFVGSVSVSSVRNMPSFRPNALDTKIRNGEFPDKNALIDESNSNGKYGASLSPAYMIKDPDGIYINYLKEGLSAYKKTYPNAKYIFWNLEPLITQEGEMDRQSFSESLNIGKILTKDEIRSTYYAKWKAFRFNQTTLLIKQASDLLRQEWPEIKLVLCGAGLFADALDLTDPYCATDPRQYDTFVDLHTPMIYYSGTKFFDDTNITVKYTKKPICVLIDPNEMDKTFYDRYTPKSVKQNIVAAAAVGCHGIYFWHSDGYDGRYLQEIADGFSLVSTVEEIYKKGTDITDKCNIAPVNSVLLDIATLDSKTSTVKVPELNSKSRFRIHKYSDSYAVTLLNYYDNSPIIFKVSIPDASGKIQVAEADGPRYTKDGKDISDNELREGILVEVPPNSVKVLRIEPGEKLDAVKDVLPQEKVFQKLETALCELKKNKISKSVSADNVKIEMVLMDNYPRLSMTAANAQVVMNENIGGITAFLNQERIDSLYHRNTKSRGVLGVLELLEDGRAIQPGAFEITAYRITAKGDPEITIEYEVLPYSGAAVAENKFEGLKIKEVWTLGVYDNIKVDYTLTNANPKGKTLKTAFKIKTYPRIGDLLAKGKKITSISSISLLSEKKPFIIQTGTPENSCLFSINGKKLPLDIKTSPLKWDGSEAVLKAQGEKDSVSMTLTPDMSAIEGFYCWWSEGLGLYTAEFVSGEKELKPGDSWHFNFNAKISYKKEK